MVKITTELIEQINEEVTGDTFWEIVDKYGLEIPEEYNFKCLSDNDGIEVWGISAQGEFLVWDNEDGFTLLSEYRWIEEVQGHLESRCGYEFAGISTLEVIKETLKKCDVDEC